MTERFLSCDICITGIGLRPSLVLEMDPVSGDIKQVRQIGDQPTVAVKGLGNLPVNMQFLNTCLQLQEKIQNLPKQKLLEGTCENSSD